MRRTWSGRSAAAIAALCLVGAGCSSTAQHPVAPVAPAVPLTAPEAPPKAFKTNGSKQVPAQAAPPVAPPGGAVSGTAVATAERAAAAAFLAAAPRRSEQVVEASRQAPVGPGVTADTISFGIRIQHPNRSMVRLLGNEDAGSFTPEERKAMHRAAAAAINAAGGILGRRVRPVFWEFASSDYDSFAEQERAGCTYFTEEKEVFAVLGVAMNGLTECMERHGVVSFNTAFSHLDVDLYRRYRHVVAPTAMSLDRQAALYVNGLVHQGFFRPGDRVGFVTWDDPIYERVVTRVLKPALERAGVSLTDEARVQPLEDESDIPRAIADAESVIVRFKHKGINKLLMLDHTGGIKTFMDLAEKHDYRPTYGLYSLTGGAHDAPAEQLRGAVGVGWLPLSDIDVKAGLRTAPEAARRCRDLMHAHGLKPYDNYLPAVTATTACDFWLFMKMAIEAGAPAITPDSAVRGAERVGRAFGPGQTFASWLGPGRHDGVAAYRHFRFFMGCECFRYTSGLYRAP